MTQPTAPAIPAYQLYGEQHAFPDVLHCEAIRDRAAGHDWRIGAHRHLHLHQLFLLRTGEIALTLDGARLTPAPPVALSIPRGVAHSFRFAAGTEGHVVTLPLQELAPLFPDGAEALDRPALAPADAALAALFRAIAAEHRGSAPLRAGMLRALAGQALAAIWRAGGQAAAGPAVDPRLVRFAAAVPDRLRDRWSVADHARALAVSPRHLSRLCRAAWGISAQGYVEAQTMREACRLLAYTRASVQSVGHQLGFDDPSYFTRAFRRHLGLSPKAYRARLDGQGD
ncbi:MAG: AraC family transcriptional regulator [Rhodobacterales bacterium]|nr:AraC family transcriptional regulator [Rhodobacterales bacterium]